MSFRTIKKQFQFILAECRRGQNKNGVQYGPFQLYSRFSRQFLFPSITIPFESDIGYKQLSNYVENNHRKRNLVTLGGDHSITASILPHYFNTYKHELHVVWIDAHADIHTQASSPSKNTHGMVLSKIFGLDDSNAIVKKCYKPEMEQLSYFGVRETEDFEENIMYDNNITCFTVDDIKSKAYKNHENLVKNKFVYISFDVDSICSSVVTATGTPVSNGLYVDEVCDIIETIKEQNVMIGCDVVEFNPLLHDNNKQTEDACAKVLHTLLR